MTKAQEILERYKEDRNRGGRGELAESKATLNDQIGSVIAISVHLGLYDAAEWIEMAWGNTIDSGPLPGFSTP